MEDVSFNSHNITPSLNKYLKIIKYPIKEKLNTPIKENLKDNNTNNNNTINNTINKEKKNENYQNDICDYQKQFQEFYSLYPKKVTKKEKGNLIPSR